MWFGWGEEGQGNNNNNKPPDKPQPQKKQESDNEHRESWFGGILELGEEIVGSSQRSDDETRKIRQNIRKLLEDEHKQDADAKAATDAILKAMYKQEDVDAVRQELKQERMGSLLGALDAGGVGENDDEIRRLLENGTNIRVIELTYDKDDVQRVKKIMDKEKGGGGGGGGATAPAASSSTNGSGTVAGGPAAARAAREDDPIQAALSPEVKKGNADTVNHDALEGPRTHKHTSYGTAEEKKKDRKKFVSKEQRLKSLEASVEEQDIQLQKTLGDMEIINKEKRDLQRQLQEQDTELSEILQQLETQGKYTPPGSSGGGGNNNNGGSSTSTSARDAEIIEDLKRQLKEAQSNNGGSRAAMSIGKENNQGDSAELEALKDAHQKEVEKLMEKISTMKVQQTAMKSQLKEHNQMQNEYGPELDRLKAFEKEAKSIQEELQAENDRLQEEMKSISSNQAQQSETSQTTLEDLAAKMLKLESENAGLETAMTLKDEKLQEADGKIQQLQANQSNLQSSNIALLEQVSEAHDKLTTEQEKLQEQEDQIKELQEQIEQLEASKTQAEESLHKQTELIASLEDEIDELEGTSASAEEAKKQIDVLKSQMAEQQISHEAELEEANDRASSLEAQLAEAQTSQSSELEEAIMHAASLEAKISDLETSHKAALEEANNKISSLESQSTAADEAKGKADLLESQISDLQSSHQAALEEANNKVSSLESQLSELQTSHSSESEEAKSKIASLEEQISDLESSHKAALEEATNKITSLESQNSEIQSSQSSAVDEAKQKADSLESQISDLQSSHQAALEEANGKVSSLESQLSELQTSHSTESEEAKSKIASLEEQVSNLETSHKSALEEANSKISSLESQNSEIEGSQSTAMEEAKQKADSLESQIADLQSSHQTALEEANNKVSSLESQLSELQTSHATESEEAKSKIESLEGQVSELETSHKAALEEANSKIASLESQNSEIQSSRSSAVDEAKQKADSLESQIADLQSSHQTALEEANNKVSTLESQLSESQATHSATVGELKGRVTVLETQITNLESSKASLEEQLKESSSKLMAAESESSAVLETIKKSLSEALEKATSLETANTELSSAKTALEEQLQEVNSKMSKLESESGSELEAARSSLAEVKDKLSSLETELAESKTQQQEALDKLSAVESEYASLQGAKEASEKLLQETLEELSKLEQADGLLRSDKDSQSAELQSMKEELQEVKEKLANLGAVEEQAKEANEKLVKAEEEFEKATLMLEALEEELTNLQSNKTADEEKLEAANKRISTLENELQEAQQAKNELLEEKDDLETILEEADSAAKRLRETITRLEEDAVQLKGAKKDLEDQLTSLEEAAANGEDQTKTAMSSLEDNLESAQKEAKEAHDARIALEVTLQETRTTVEELKASISEKDIEVKAVLDQKDSLEEAKSAAQSSLEEAQATLEELKVSLSKKEEELEASQNEKERLKENVSAMESSLQMTQSQLDEVKQLLSGKEAELRVATDGREGLSRAQEGMESELAETKAALENLKEVASQKEQEFLAEKEKLQEAVVQHEEEKDSVEAELHQFKAFSESQYAQMREAEEKAIAAEDELEQIKTAKAASDDQIASLESVAQEKDAFISALNSRIAGLESTVQAQEEKLSQLQSSNAAMGSVQSEVSALQEENQALSDEKDSLEQEVSSFIHTLNDLQGKLSAANAELQALHEGKANIEAQLRDSEITVQTLETEIAALKRAKQSIAEEKDSLQQEINSRSAMDKDNVSDKSVLEQQISKLHQSLNYGASVMLLGYTGTSDRENPVLRPPRKYVSFDGVMRWNPEFKRWKQQQQLAIKAPNRGSTSMTDAESGKRRAPRKYLRIDGIMRWNPEYRSWKEQQQPLAVTAPSNRRGTGTTDTASGKRRAPRKYVSFDGVMRWNPEYKSWKEQQQHFAVTAPSNRRGTGSTDTASGKRRAPRKYVRLDGVMRWNPEFKRWKQQQQLALAAPNRGSSSTTDADSGKRRPPRKYVRVDGLMRWNPEYKRWLEQEQRLEITAPAKQGSTGTEGSKSLKQLVSELESLTQGYHTQVQESTKKLSALQSEKASLTLQVSNLKGELTKFRAEANYLRQKDEKARRQSLVRERELEAANEELEQKRTKELQENASSMQSLNEKSTELMEANSRLASLERDMAHVQKIAQEEFDAKEKLEKDLQEMTATADGLQQTLNDKATELMEANSRLASLERDIVHVQKIAQEEFDAKEKLEKDLLEKTSAAEELQQLLNDKATELMEANSRLASLERDMAHVQKVAEKEFEAKEKLTEEVADVAKSRMATLQEQIEVAQSEAKEAHKAKKTLEGELKVSLAEKEALKVSLAQARADHSKESEDREHLKAERINLHNQIAELEANLKGIFRARDGSNPGDLHRTEEGLEDGGGNKSAKRDSKLLHDVSERLKRTRPDGTVRSGHSVGNSSDICRTSSDDDYQALVSENESLRDAVVDLEDQKIIMDKELSEAKRLLEERDINKTLLREKTALGEEVQQLRSSLYEKDQQTGQVSTKLGSLQEDLTQTQTRMQGLVDIREGLEKEVAKLQKRNQWLRQEKEAMERRFKSMKGSLSNKDKQLGRTSTKLTSLVDDLRRAQKEMHDAVEAKLKDTNQIAEEEKGELLQELSQLKKSLKEEAANLKEASDMLASMVLDIDGVVNETAAVASVSGQKSALPHQMKYESGRTGKPLTDGTRKSAVEKDAILGAMAAPAKRAVKEESQDDFSIDSSVDALSDVALDISDSIEFSATPHNDTKTPERINNPSGGPKQPDSSKKVNPRSDKDKNTGDTQILEVMAVSGAAPQPKPPKTTYDGCDIDSETEIEVQPDDDTWGFTGILNFLSGPTEDETPTAEPPAPTNPLLAEPASPRKPTYSSKKIQFGSESEKNLHDSNVLQAMAAPALIADPKPMPSRYDCDDDPDFDIDEDVLASPVTAEMEEKDMERMSSSNNAILSAIATPTTKAVRKTFDDDLSIDSSADMTSEDDLDFTDSNNDPVPSGSDAPIPVVPDAEVKRPRTPTTPTYSAKKIEYGSQSEMNAHSNNVLQAMASPVPPAKPKAAPSLYDCDDDPDFEVDTSLSQSNDQPDQEGIQQMAASNNAILFALASPPSKPAAGKGIHDDFSIDSASDEEMDDGENGYNIHASSAEQKVDSGSSQILEVMAVSGAMPQPKPPKTTYDGCDIDSETEIEVQPDDDAWGFTGIFNFLSGPTEDETPTAEKPAPTANSNPMLAKPASPRKPSYASKKIQFGSESEKNSHNSNVLQAMAAPALMAEPKPIPSRYDCDDDPDFDIEDEALASPEPAEMEKMSPSNNAILSAIATPTAKAVRKTFDDDLSIDSSADMTSEDDLDFTDSNNDLIPAAAVDPTPVVPVAEVKRPRTPTTPTYSAKKIEFGSQSEMNAHSNNVLQAMASPVPPAKPKAASSLYDCDDDPDFEVDTSLSQWNDQPNQEGIQQMAVSNNAILFALASPPTKPAAGKGIHDDFSIDSASDEQMDDGENGCNALSPKSTSTPINDSGDATVQPSNHNHHSEALGAGKNGWSFAALFSNFNVELKATSDELDRIGTVLKTLELPPSTGGKFHDIQGQRGDHVPGKSRKTLETELRLSEIKCKEVMETNRVSQVLIDQHEATIKATSEQAASLQSALDDTKALLTDANDTIKNLQEERDSSDKKIAELQSKLGRQRRRGKSVRFSTRIEQIPVEEIEEETDKLQEVLQAAQQAALQAAGTASQPVLQAAQQAAGNASQPPETELGKHSSNMSAEEHNELKKLSEQQQMKLETATARLEFLQEKSEQQELKLETANARLEFLQGKCDDLEAKAAQMIKEKESLEAQIEEFKSVATPDPMMGTITEESSWDGDMDVETLREEHGEALEERDFLREILSDSKAAIDSLKDELKKVESGSSSKLDLVGQRNNELEDSLEQIKLNLKTALSERDALQVALDEAQAANQNQELEESLEQTKLNLKIALSEKDELKVALGEAQAANRNQGALKTVPGEEEKLLHLSQQQELMLETAKARVEYLQEKSEQQELKLETSNARVEYLQDTVAELETKMAQISKDKESLQNQQHELDAQLDILMHRFVPKHTRKMDPSNEPNVGNKLLAKLLKLASVADTDRADLIDTSERLEAIVSEKVSLERNLDSVAQTLQSSLSKECRLEEMLEEAHEKIATLKSTNAEEEDAGPDLELERKVLAARIAELQANLEQTRHFPEVAVASEDSLAMELQTATRRLHELDLLINRGEGIDVPPASSEREQVWRERIRHLEGVVAQKEQTIQNLNRSLHAAASENNSFGATDEKTRRDHKGLHASSRSLRGHQPGSSSNAHTSRDPPPSSSSKKGIESSSLKARIAELEDFIENNKVHIDLMTGVQERLKTAVSERNNLETQVDRLLKEREQSVEAVNQLLLLEASSPDKVIPATRKSGKTPASRTKVPPSSLLKQISILASNVEDLRAFSAQKEKQFLVMRSDNREMKMAMEKSAEKSVKLLENAKKKLSELKETVRVTREERDEYYDRAYTLQGVVMQMEADKEHEIHLLDIVMEQLNELDVVMMHDSRANSPTKQNWILPKKG